jgi:parvulin-like peptidyl-prolyl isomerase
MTLRAKPVVKRSRSPWASEDRRNFYTNLGFGLVIVLAIGLLAVAAGASWYEDHFGFVASVEDETITRDHYRDRLLVESFRLDIAESRARTEQAAGRWTEAQLQNELSLISQRRSSLTSVVLEQLVDATLQRQLAAAEGIEVSDAMVDAQLVMEATTPLQRHVWTIDLIPPIDPDAFEPTPAQIEQTREKAEAIVERLRDGEDFEEVAKAESGGGTAAQGGDLGWIVVDSGVIEPSFAEAVFAAPLGDVTEAVFGTDEIFRIGRATEQLDEAVDPTYEQRIVDEGLSLDVYRIALRADATRLALQDKIVGGLLEPGPQRSVQEIYIAEPQASLGDDAVKTRHILYSPNNDPSTAADVPEDDPAWEDAEERASETYEILRRDISQFDAIARLESSEGQARSTGGKLPYFDSSSGIDEDFAAAVLDDGLRDGQLLRPVRSAFGWHVIQIMYRPPDIDQLRKLKAEIDAGEDIGPLARDFSDAAEAEDGGDIGWVARGQFDERLIAAIFATPIGETSDIITIAGEGIYLFQINAEETRAPDREQEEAIREGYFGEWYSLKKEAVSIERNEIYLGTGS